MPQFGPIFRPAPKPLVSTPFTVPDAAETQPEPQESIPEPVPTEDLPDPYRVPPSPRPRKLGNAPESAAAIKPVFVNVISIPKWSVNPYRIARDLGIAIK